LKQRRGPALRKVADAHLGQIGREEAPSAEMDVARLLRRGRPIHRSKGVGGGLAGWLRGADTPQIFNDMVPPHMFDMRRTGGNASLGHDAGGNARAFWPVKSGQVGDFRRGGQRFHFAGFFREGERMSARDRLSPECPAVLVSRRKCCGGGQPRSGAGVRIALIGGGLLVVKNEFSHEHDQ